MQTISLLIALLLSTAVFSQSPDQWNAEIDRLEAIPNEKAALNKTVEAIRMHPQHVGLLSRAAELCCRIGVREQTTASRNQFYENALSYAKRAYKLAPQSDVTHTVMAMALGVAILEKSNKEKIGGVREIKSHCENAVKINPNNFKAWYVLGRWHAEVSGLNMFERAATKVFYGGLPSASLKQAIMFYSKARTLKPDFMLNLLYLAKAYDRNDEPEKAKDALKQLLKQKNQTEDDPGYKQEAEEMLKDL